MLGNYEGVQGDSQCFSTYLPVQRKENIRGKVFTNEIKHTTAPELKENHGKVWQT